jgi:hypothetical protein
MWLLDVRLYEQMFVGPDRSGADSMTQMQSLSKQSMESGGMPES